MHTFINNITLLEYTLLLSLWVARWRTPSGSMFLIRDITLSLQNNNLQDNIGNTKKMYVPFNFQVVLFTQALPHGSISNQRVWCLKFPLYSQYRAWDWGVQHTVSLYSEYKVNDTYPYTVFCHLQWCSTDVCSPWETKAFKLRFKPSQTTRKISLA